MKHIKIILAAVLAVGLVACGDVVEVPPAHVGKIMTKEGLQPENFPPSKFRLEACMAYCDKLYVAEVSDKAYSESFTVFMPKDQLNMTFDIRINGSVKSDENSVNTIFDKLPVDNGDGSRYHGVVYASAVYAVYAQPVVRSAVRDVMTSYTINEIASNRESINGQLQDRLSNALGNVPFRVNTIQLADVQFPEVIVKAKEAQKEREIAIEKQEAENEIRFRQLDADLKAAQQKRKIDREKAEAAKEQNEIYAKSVSENFLKWKQLEILEDLAQSDNKVFVPFEALGTVGLSNRVLNGAK